MITSATFRTYPSFNASLHAALIFSPTTGDAGTIAEIHANHAHDWDDVRAGQYFYMFNFLAMPEVGEELGFGPGVLIMAATYFKDLDEASAMREMKGFMDDVRALEAQGKVLVALENVTVASANDLLYNPDGMAGGESVHGSRLIPGWVYREKAKEIGNMHIELLNEGVQQ